MRLNEIINGARHVCELIRWAKAVGIVNLAVHFDGIGMASNVMERGKALMERATQFSCNGFSSLILITVPHFWLNVSTSSSSSKPAQS